MKKYKICVYKRSFNGKYLIATIYGSYEEIKKQMREKGIPRNSRKYVYGIASLN